MISCHYCEYTCEDYKDLALHIQLAGKSHQKGLKFAAKYLTRVEYLNQKRDLNGRLPLTEQDKENKENTQRELSGNELIANTICPICKHTSYKQLPIEHVNNPLAWRIGSTLAVNCLNCRK